jgi:starch phosphorylase
LCQNLDCQRLDASGWQREEPNEWGVEDFLTELPTRASMTVEGRTVYFRAWQYEVKAAEGFTVPVYLLDTDVPETPHKTGRLTLGFCPARHGLQTGRPVFCTT